MKKVQITKMEKSKFTNILATKNETFRNNIFYAKNLQFLLYNILLLGIFTSYASGT